jgi:hypothetical protein
MDEEAGEMNVKEETIRVAAHFFLQVQFSGSPDPQDRAT